MPFRIQGRTESKATAKPPTPAKVKTIIDMHAVSDSLHVHHTENNMILPLKNKLQTAEAVTDAVCDTWGVTLDEIKGSSREQPLAFARQVAMTLCREVAEMSFPEIGRHFNRSHATAIHSIKSVTKHSHTNHKVSTLLKSVIQQISKKQQQQ
jgi:chromosomal replication initiation ATPase DnaA